MRPSVLERTETWREECWLGEDMSGVHLAIGIGFGEGDGLGYSCDIRGMRITVEDGAAEDRCTLRANGE